MEIKGEKYKELVIVPKVWEQIEVNGLLTTVLVSEDVSKYIRHLEQLNLGVVSQQRELLKGFMQYVNCTATTNHIYGHLLEDYLKTL